LQTIVNSRHGPHAEEPGEAQPESSAKHAPTAPMPPLEESSKSEPPAQTLSEIAPESSGLPPLLGLAQSPDRRIYVSLSDSDAAPSHLAPPPRARGVVRPRSLEPAARTLDPNHHNRASDAVSLHERESLGPEMNREDADRLFSTYAAEIEQAIGWLGVPNGDAELRPPAPQE
jgi:hypothetical protein